MKKIDNTEEYLETSSFSIDLTKEKRDAELIK